MDGYNDSLKIFPNKGDNWNMGDNLVWVSFLLFGGRVRGGIKQPCNGVKDYEK